MNTTRNINLSIKKSKMNTIRNTMRLIKERKFKSFYELCSPLRFMNYMI